MARFLLWVTPVIVFSHLTVGNIIRVTIVAFAALVNILRVDFVGTTALFLMARNWPSLHILLIP